MRRLRRFYIALTLLVAAGMVSCGKQQPSLVPASGTILYANGKPVLAGRLTFWPKDDPKGFINRHKSTPFCITDEKGRFELRMNAKDVGVPPGQYRVTVTWILPADEQKIPKRYTDPQTTPWEVTIPPEGEKGLSLRIEGR